MAAAARQYKKYRPRPWTNLRKGECKLCDSPNWPVTHTGSPNCTSGSPASGGNRPHCTCDLCF